MIDGIGPIAEISDLLFKAFATLSKNLILCSARGEPDLSKHIAA